MNNYKIISLSEVYAASIRKTHKDNFGHEVVEEMATGYGPCRVSLQPFVPGEDIRIVFSHSPFDIRNVYDQPGPVFIHQKAVKAYPDIYLFPPEIKADQIHFPLTLIGYNREQKMNFTQLVGDRDVDLLIEQVFKDHPEIEYLHARNAEAGCFICKIGRLRD